jgi:hypothetical protein
MVAREARTAAKQARQNGAKTVGDIALALLF